MMRDEGEPFTSLQTVENPCLKALREQGAIIHDQRLVASAILDVIAPDHQFGAAAMDLRSRIDGASVDLADIAAAEAVIAKRVAARVAA